jgi:uncharacterized membrane protein YbjE (DUF340 family)
MITFLQILFIGFLVGTALKSFQIRTSWAGSFLQAIVVVLLFLMGISIGSNSEIVSSLLNLGALAFLIAVLSILMSALLAILLKKITSRFL